MGAELLKLPQNGFAPDNKSIAEHLREVADWIERNDLGAIRNTYLIIETGSGDLERYTCGQPCDRARLVGVLTMLTARLATGE